LKLRYRRTPRRLCLCDFGD